MICLPVFMIEQKTLRYNAALAMQDLVEYSHQVFAYDNAALGSIVQKTLEVDTPKMNQLNNIVALCMSGTV